MKILSRKLKYFLNNKRFIVVGSIFCLLFFSSIFNCFALEQEYPPLRGETITVQSELPELINYFFNFALMAGGIVALVIITMAGIRWMSAVADPHQKQEAIGQIRAGLIGLLIILASYLILSVINPQMTRLEINPLPQLESAGPGTGGTGGAGDGGDEPPTENIVTAILDLPLKIALGIVVFFLTFALGIIQLVFGLFAFFAAILLEWIVELPVYLTHGGIVDVGWGFCRDIANMFFIVALVVIAYATMLRKESYAMKSALPAFIICALLINFSQMICGVIIDAVNIVMHFFITQGAANAPAHFLQQNAFFSDILGLGGKKGFWEDMKQLFLKPPMEFAIWCLSKTTKAIVGIIFNLVEFLILAAYGIVLVIRIAIIWILVMLSPLAWICYILPATKSIWSNWWKQFTQWATIGVFMLFFLYLAGYILSYSADIDILASCQQSPVKAYDAKAFPEEFMNKIQKEIGEEIGAFFCQVLPSIVALILLFLGLFMGFSMGAGAPGFASKIMQAPTRAAWGWTKENAPLYAQRMGRPTLKQTLSPFESPKGLQKLLYKYNPSAMTHELKGGLRKMFVRGDDEKTIPDIMRTGKKRAVFAPALMGLDLVQGIRDSALAKKVARQKTKSDKLLENELATKFGVDKAVNLALLNERGSLKLQKGKIEDKDIVNAIKITMDTGLEKGLIKSFAHLAPQIGKSVGEVVEKLKVSDMRTVSKESYQNDDVQKEMLRYLKEAHYQQLEENPDAIQASIKYLRNQGKDYKSRITAIKNINPGVAQYIDKNPRGQRNFKQHLG